MSKTAPCKFCGQVNIVPDDCTDPIEEATRVCSCDSAEFFRRLEGNMLKAKSNAVLICDDEVVREFLNHAIELAGTGKLKNMTQTDGNGVRYTVRMKADGTFKIEKSITRKESIE